MQPPPKPEEKKKEAEGGDGGGEGDPTQLAIRTVMMNKRFMGLGHHAADRVLAVQVRPSPSLCAPFLIFL
jgi:hypothetical protein